MARRVAKSGADSAPVPIPGMRAVRGLSLLNRLLAVVAVAGAVFVSAAVWLKPRVEKLRESERELERLRVQVEERRREEARLQRQLDWLEKDPDYLAMILRDRFDLMAEGETLYRIEPRPPAGAGRAAAAVKRPRACHPAERRAEPALLPAGGDRIRAFPRNLFR